MYDASGRQRSSCLTRCDARLLRVPRHHYHNLADVVPFLHVFESIDDLRRFKDFHGFDQWYLSLAKKIHELFKEAYRRQLAPFLSFDGILLTVCTLPVFPLPVEPIQHRRRRD